MWNWQNCWWWMQFVYLQISWFSKNWVLSVLSRSVSIFKAMVCCKSHITGWLDIYTGINRTDRCTWIAWYAGHTGRHGTSWREGSQRTSWTWCESLTYTSHSVSTNVLFDWKIVSETIINIKINIPFRYKYCTIQVKFEIFRLWNLLLI